MRKIAARIACRRLEAHQSRRATPTIPGPAQAVAQSSRASEVLQEAIDVASTPVLLDCRVSKHAVVGPPKQAPKAKTAAAAMTDETSRCRRGMFSAETRHERQQQQQRQQSTRGRLERWCRRQRDQQVGTRWF